MELEALQDINSEVKALGAQIVVLTPELERYTRNLHRKSAGCGALRGGAALARLSDTGGAELARRSRCLDRIAR